MTATYMILIGIGCLILGIIIRWFKAVDKPWNGFRQPEIKIDPEKLNKILNSSAVGIINKKAEKDELGVVLMRSGSKINFTNSITIQCRGKKK